MSSFLLVIASLALFALSWFVCRLLANAPPNSQSTGNPEIGCWEGGAGVRRKQSWGL